MSKLNNFFITLNLKIIHLREVNLRITYIKQNILLLLQIFNYKYNSSKDKQVEHYTSESN